MLKELSKTGLREVAFEIFDWLRTLDEQLHPDYVGLLDVFTYTTMIVSRLYCQRVRSLSACCVRRLVGGLPQVQAVMQAISSAHQAPRAVPT